MRVDAGVLVERLPQLEQDFLATNRTGAPKWLIGESAEFRNLIIPNPHEVNRIVFPDSNGRLVPELNLIEASNAIAVNYIDPANSKRPSDPRSFVVADPLPSSKMSLDVAFGIEPQAFCQQAREWLARMEVRVIPSKIADGPLGSVADVAYFAPRGLEWAKVAWDLIHGTPSRERLEQDYNPKVIFYSVPGLRDQFGNAQCTVFERSEGGILRIYSNSSYIGLSMSKKPIFVALSHLLREEGGMLAHGTMAVLEGANVIGLPVRKGMIYHAASGHGKTEFRYVRQGRISLGVHAEGHSLTLDYPAPLRPSIVCAGDDGVIIRDFRRGEGFGVGETSEKEGAFDRPSGSKKPGDLPENDQLFQQAQGDPFSQLTLNLLAQPGQAMETHQRELENGKPHSNPRQIYRWKDLAKLELLRDERVSFTTDPITFDTSIFGMGVTPKTAVLSWLNRLPVSSAYTLMLAGVCRSKSVSVTDNGQHADHGLKLDKFGTMESFSINADVDNANRLWDYYANFNRVRHFAVPIGNVGPKISVEDNEAELLARDFLFQREAGRAIADFVPHPCPFFGLIPSNAQFLGQPIPAEYSDPSRQFKSRTEFIEACAIVIDLMRDGLRPIITHQELHEEARQAILKALTAPLHIRDPQEAMERFRDLNSIPRQPEVIANAWPVPLV